MGYEGGRLAPWFHDGPTKAIAHRMGEKGRDRLLEKIVEHTPMHTGQLKSSWKATAVVLTMTVEGYDAYESRVETEKDYAPYVEHGTGLWGPKHMKYPIRPKIPGGVLHFFSKEGGEVFTKLVMHPGSPGKHMVSISVAELELELPMLMKDDLEMWAELTAAQNTTSFTGF